MRTVITADPNRTIDLFSTLAAALLSRAMLRDRLTTARKIGLFISSGLPRVMQGLFWHGSSLFFVTGKGRRLERER
jgi:hypothetical protein